MKRQSLKIVNLLIVITLIITAFMPSIVNAAPDLTQTEGSLEITKYEVSGNGQNTLAGVTFDIYKVGDYETSTELPTDAAILATKQSATTAENGVVNFTGLALGRYLVVESDAPANVVSRISNFLVDIPMTSDNGEELIYNVEVSPKNNTVYGGVVLQKVDAKTNVGLENVEFELQKLDGENWKTYGEAMSTADGTNDKDASGNVLEKGKIEVSGLPAGSYRFVEKTTFEGYILDNKTTYPFNVSLGENGQTIVDNSLIIVKNEKPTLTKNITSTLAEGSVNVNDSVSYKIETPIPTLVDEINTYKIKETIDSGLTYTDNTIKVVAVSAENTETTLVENTDYTLTANADKSELEIIFTNVGKEKLALNSNLKITYDAILNENAIVSNLGNNTNTVLTYSTIVNEDYLGNANNESTNTLSADTPVYTGGIFIKKVDDENNIIPTGATFKIAVSEENAKNGIFINNIELTTGENGLVSYKGLAYGKYWLVETKAPTYETTDSEGNQINKSYNLLRKPIEITVNDSTYTENAAIEIINRKGFQLPATGAIGSVIVSGLGLVIILLGIKSFKGKEEN